MNKPQLSKQAFWDVNMDNIDCEKNALFIMERIICGNSFEDFISIRNFYGDDRFKQEIIHSKELGPKEVSFCCAIFHLTKEEFKYPTSKPAYPTAWDYSGA
jgi:hypothetical protein